MVILKGFVKWPFYKTELPKKDLEIGTKNEEKKIPFLV